MKIPRLLLLAVSSLVVSSAQALVSGPGASSGHRMPSSFGTGSHITTGQLILRLKTGVNRDSFLARNSLQLLREIPQIDASVVSVPEGEETFLARQLGARGEVIYAEPDGIAYALNIPNDPLYKNYQWYSQITGLPDAWDLTTGAANVAIAILDTGVDLSHPDLKAKLLPGYNALNPAALANDDVGHGTHVAGLAAAIGNNNVGVAGASWGASLLPVRVLNAVGEGANSSVADGIVWATDRGAKILNLSLGSPVYNSAIADAIRYARNRNCLVIAAAGNDYLSGNPQVYPAAIAGVEAVGASGDDDRRAAYSEVGNFVSVLAPGGNPLSNTDTNTNHWVISTWRVVDGGGYMSLAGTSQSAPIVSGLAALLWTLKPEYTADQIKGVIEKTAKDLGAKGRDNETGYGRIDAAAAVRSLVVSANDNAPPTLSITFPTASAFLSGTVSIQGSAEDDALKLYQLQFGVGESPKTWFNLGSVHTQSVHLGELGSLDTRNLEDGAYALRLNATDLAGNTASIGPIAFTVDNTPPTLTLTAPTEGETIHGKTAIQGSLTEMNLANYVVDIGAGDAPQEWTNLLTQDQAPLEGNLGEVELSGRPSGIYALRVLATDKAGNTAKTQIGIDYQAGTPGDVNGDGKINVSDAIQIMRMAVGLQPITDLSLADVAPLPGTGGRPYGDGKVTVSDAIRVIRKSLGLEPVNWLG
jgi:subtilisin family serine protease